MHRTSVEVELKAYLDRTLIYVQWEGWRWRNLDGQAVDPTLALEARHKVGGVDTAIVQLYASDGESLTTVAEEVAMLRKAILKAVNPPERLVVYVLSNDLRRKVADVIRDVGDDEPSTGG